MIGHVLLKGEIYPRLLSTQISAPLSWKIKNILRWSFMWGWLTTKLARGFSAVTGIPTLIGELRVRKFVDGRIIDYGVVCYRVITTAFVNFMVDQLQAETAAWGDFKFHDSGVGITDPAVGDTDIETTDGEARATGSQTESAANVYRSVGTIAYTTTKAITEHGLFNAAVGPTLLDRSEFAVINVVSGNSIEFTYDLTVTAGG